MRFDHVAVPSKDIPQSVEWYRKHFNAKVLYEDATWAFLQLGGTKLALVTPTQHPPHIAMSLTDDALRDAAALANVAIDTHRDGSQGIYLYDPDGNAVELINYPQGKTVYAQRAPGTDAEQTGAD
jgi:catechol 2,3-dioxygenase-like lactoylglutathione lyase family enzyme